MSLLSLSGLFSTAGSTLRTIVIAVLLFAFLIFVHELGHFLSAKLLGVRVNEFSLGFGPAIFKKQKGETLYALRIIPFGGYCAMEGEEEESDEEGSFSRKPAWKRFIITFAGAFNNLVLGFLVVVILMGINDGAFASSTVSRFRGDDIRSASTGLREGDTIRKVNGSRIFVADDITYEIMRDSDGIVEMEVLRDGEKVALPAVEFKVEPTDEGFNLVYVDFYVQPMEKNFGSVISQAGLKTVSIARMVWQSLFDLVTGRYGINQLAGPVGTANVIGQAANRSMEDLLYIIALITINLGVFNLLPIPALDGGRLFFLLIEMISRKKIPPKYEGYIHTAGFALLILLMVFVTFNDIVRLIKG